MKQNKWIAMFLCFALLLCAGCGTGQQGETTTATTTQQDFSIPDAFPTQSGELPGRETPYPTVKIPTSPDDPYAQVIKEMYEQYAQYVTAEEIFEDLKYTLYDIDKDGTKELLLSRRYILWGYEGPEFEYESDEIGKEAILFDRFYYIANGKAVEMPLLNGLWDGAAGPTGGRDLLTNGVIRLCGGSPNYTSYAYFRYANGDLELLNSLRYYEDTGYWQYIYEGIQCTGKKITEEEFNRMRAEIEGDAQVVEIDWKPLESYGRE